jgi:hypothetical protein
MKIDVTRFCGLSRRDDFQNWLRSVSSEYCDELISFLKLGKSCGDNKTKMEEIYKKLINDNKSELMIEFLHKNYPHMIIHDKNSPNKININNEKITPTIDELNYHKVFQKYKPGFLLIPHQMIFIDNNYRLLENRVIEFIRMKIQTDYLILRGPQFFHGYIEYFEKEFASEAAKFDNHNRPIFIYKK